MNVAACDSRYPGRAEGFLPEVRGLQGAEHAFSGLVEAGYEFGLVDDVPAEGQFAIADGILQEIHDRSFLGLAGSGSEHKAQSGQPAKSLAANDWADCCATTTAKRPDLRWDITPSSQEPVVIVCADVSAQPRNQLENLAFRLARHWNSGFRSIDIGRQGSALAIPTIEEMRN
jgi:hypothetical protein